MVLCKEKRYDDVIHELKKARFHAEEMDRHNKEEKYSFTAPLFNRLQGENLLDAVERAILERLPVAEAFEPYRSVKERRYKYYRIYVKNFVVYYVVIDDEDPEKIMEVRLFLYNKQDREMLV